MPPFSDCLLLSAPGCCTRGNAAGLSVPVPKANVTGRTQTCLSGICKSKINWYLASYSFKVTVLSEVLNKDVFGQRCKSPASNLCSLENMTSLQRVFGFTRELGSVFEVLCCTWMETVNLWPKADCVVNI